jgi:hypothetical protein
MARINWLGVISVVLQGLGVVLGVAMLVVMVQR